MPLSRRVILAAAVTLSLLCTTCFADTGLVNETGGVLAVSQFDQTLGWAFNLNTEVRLDRLGFFDSNNDGLIASHDVGIWTAAGDLVASVTVPEGTNGLLLDGFRYVNVPSVQLPVGEYIIGGHFGGSTFGNGSQELFIQGSSSIETHPFVEYVGRAGGGPGFEFPTPNPQTGGTDFTAVNFQFNLPEPSTVILLLVASGVGGFVRRCR